MAFCPECGSKLNDGARFCPNCGADLSRSTDTTPVYAPPQPPYTPPQPPYTPPSYPPVPEKKHVNKNIFIFGGLAVILIVLVVVLIKLLGGGASKDSPYVGTWNATTVQMSGYEFGIEEVYAGGFTLELKSNGKCTMVLEGENYIGSWDYTDGVMTVRDSETELVGTVSGNVMALAWADFDMTLSFVKEGAVIPTAAPTAAPEPTATPEPVVDTSYIDWWDGDWYGWWIVGNNTGTYENWVDDWWDCCARITVDQSGMAAVTFWDEYDTEDSPTAMFNATVTSDGMTIGSGSFMYMSTSDAGFIVTTGYKYLSGIIRIDGYYEDGDGSFDFVVYLRPWGMLWDDWYAVDSSCLPYYYDDWYVPAIEADAAMPGEINGEYVSGSGTGYRADIYE